MLKKLIQTCSKRNGQFISAKRQLSAVTSRTVEEKIASSAPVIVDANLFKDVRARIFNSRDNIEKIVVNVNESGSQKAYLLNRNESTPLTCAKHMSVHKLSNYGLVELTYESGTVEYSSLNAPVTHKCDIAFIDFNTTNNEHIEALNKSYWLSCSVLLGAVLKSGIQLDISTSLVSRTPKQLTFAVDVGGLKETDLTNQDLIDLSRYAHREFIATAKPLEYLNVPANIAQDYGYSSSVQLCKLGDFVTEVDMPTISHAGQVGRFALVGMKNAKGFMRISGVSIPEAQPVSSSNWDLIRSEAAKAI